MTLLSTLTTVFITAVWTVYAALSLSVAAPLVLICGGGYCVHTLVHMLSVYVRTLLSPHRHWLKYVLMVCDGVSFVLVWAIKFMLAVYVLLQVAVVSLLRYVPLSSLDTAVGRCVRNVDVTVAPLLTNTGKDVVRVLGIGVNYGHAVERAVTLFLLRTQYIPEPLLTITWSGATLDSGEVVWNLSLQGLSLARDVPEVTITTACGDVNTCSSMCNNDSNADVGTDTTVVDTECVGIGASIGTTDANIVDTESIKPGSTFHMKTIDNVADVSAVVLGTCAQSNDTQPENSEDVEESTPATEDRLTTLRRLAKGTAHKGDKASCGH